MTTGIFDRCCRVSLTASGISAGPSHHWVLNKREIEFLIGMIAAHPANTPDEADLRCRQSLLHLADLIRTVAIWGRSPSSRATVVAGESEMIADSKRAARIAACLDEQRALSDFAVLLQSLSEEWHRATSDISSAYPIEEWHAFVSVEPSAKEYAARDARFDVMRAEFALVAARFFSQRRGRLVETLPSH